MFIIIGAIISFSACSIEGNLLESLQEIKLINKNSHNLVGKYNSTKFKKDNGDDKLCEWQMEALLDAMHSQELWAQLVVDSWGKVSSNDLDKQYELGNYDQCIAISHFISTEKGLYSGKYCLANVWETAGSIKLKVGICIPDTCLPQTITKLYAENLNSLNLTVIDSSCRANNEGSFDLLDKITMSLLFITAALMVLSTCYDIMCTRQNRSKYQALTAFSIFSNGIKIFTGEIDGFNEITCLHGIRVLSLFWVIDRHIRSISNELAVNPQYKYDFVKRYYNVISITSAQSVDAFLVLSGLLVTQTVIRQLQNHGRINVLKLYRHRYLRLTPLLAAVILFNVSLMRYMADGPLWKYFLSSKINDCSKYWWTALLYVQNYANGLEICILPSWYLSVDTQLFIFAPFLVYLLYHYKKAIIALIAALIVFASAWTVAVYHYYYITNEMFPVKIKPEKLLYDYYATHTRMSSWLIGFLLGFVMCCTNDRRISLPKHFIKIGWFLTLMGFSSVLLLNNLLQQNETIISSFYWGLCTIYSRVTWSTSLAFMIFACHKGYGGAVNGFLSLPQWKPLSRISYGTFITHMPVAHAIIYRIREPFYVSNFVILKLNFSILCVSLVISLVAALAFEFPVVTLEKLLWNDANKNIRTIHYTTKKYSNKS